MNMPSFCRDRQSLIAPLLWEQQEASFILDIFALHVKEAIFLRKGKEYLEAVFYKAISLPQGHRDSGLFRGLREDTHFIP